MIGGLRLFDFAIEEGGETKGKGEEEEGGRPCGRLRACVFGSCAVVIVYWQKCIGPGFDPEGACGSLTGRVAMCCARGTYGVEKSVSVGVQNGRRRHLRPFITTLVSTTPVFHSAILRYSFD